MIVLKSCMGSSVCSVIFSILLFKFELSIGIKKCFLKLIFFFKIFDCFKSLLKFEFGKSLKKAVNNDIFFF